MADNNQNKAEQYRKERKERLAKAAKKNAKNIEKKTAARSAIKKVVAIVLVAAIGLTCLGGILNYVGVLQSMAQVGYVKDEKLSFAEYKYYYNKAFMQFFNTEYEAKYYGYDTGSGYDASLAPDEQTTKYTDKETGKEMTWVEYFHDQAVEVAQLYLAYYQEAVKKGLELDKADLAKIDKSMDDLSEAADKYGKKSDDDTTKGYSVNAYLRAQYGSGITSSFYKKQLKLEALVQKYYDTMLKEIKTGYTDAQVKEVYDKDPDTYLFVDLRVYQFPVTALEAKEGEKDEDLAKRQEKADKELKENATKMFDAVKDEQSFVNYAKKLNEKDTTYNVDTQTLLRSYQKTDATGGGRGLSSVSPDLADWAFKDSTKKDNKKFLEIKDENGTVTGYLVVLMVNPKHDVDTVSVRHILFKTVDDENKPLEDDKIKAAQENAKKTLAEWKAGDATEESFADYATELSEDEGSQANGGFIDGNVPGQNVPEFDKWIFDEARKEGDTEIVKTDYGYHIIYFVSKDGSSMDNTIRTSLASTDFNTKSEELLDSDEYVVGVGPRRTEYVEKELLKKYARMIANINSQSQSAGY